MSNNKNEYTVSLVGGIGNQLFQYAHALSTQFDEPISITLDFDTNRSKSHKSSILDFNIQNRLTPSSVKKSHFRLKVHNLILRLSSPINTFRIAPRILSFVQKTVALLASKVLFEGNSILYQTSNGFASNPVRKQNTSIFQIGYFQHFRWNYPEKIFDTLMRLEPLKTSELYLRLNQELSQLSFLSVHMRFGDYEQEQSFGVLPESYFLDAIRWQLKVQNYAEIVIFTNDYKQAEKFASTLLDYKFRIVSSSMDLSDCETFQLMRLGKGHVIANSTFSWWSAFLSYKESAAVVYPDPWFRQMHSAWIQFPHNWKSIRSFNIDY